MPTILDLLTSAEKAFSRSREADLDANERLLTIMRKLAADAESVREHMAQLQTRIERLEAGGSGGEP